jgi:flagellar basal body-associated protein FliL
MKEIFNNLQSREKSLLIILLCIIIIGMLLSSATNLYSNLNNSSQRLNSAKSDYDYVYKQAEVLSLNLAQKGFLLNAENTYAELDKMAKDFELINYTLTRNDSELKVVYILNDL